MSRIGLAVHRFRPDALEVAHRVISWASSHEYGVVVDESDVPALGSSQVVSGDVGDTDLLISIGGDGTMLRSVTMLNGAAVPVLGINMGCLLVRFFTSNVALQSEPSTPARTLKRSWFALRKF